MEIVRLLLDAGADPWIGFVEAFMPAFANRSYSHRHHARKHLQVVQMVWNHPGFPWQAFANEICNHVATHQSNTEIANSQPSSMNFQNNTCKYWNSFHLSLIWILNPCFLPAGLAVWAQLKPCWNIIIVLRMLQHSQEPLSMTKERRLWQWPWQEIIWIIWRFYISCCVKIQMPLSRSGNPRTIYCESPNHDGAIRYLSFIPFRNVCVLHNSCKLWFFEKTLTWIQLHIVIFFFASRGNINSKWETASYRFRILF